MLKKIFVAIILFAACITIAQADAAKNLKISMFDIGHGDAILIQTSKQTILIDTAKPDKRAEFVRELEKFSVTKIDKLIVTHPHADHIGGAKMLINANQAELTAYPYLKKISVAEVYDNGVAHTSKLYKNYLKAIQTKKITRHSLKAGDTLDFGGGVKFKIFSPSSELVATLNANQFDKKDRQYNVNNGSIVGKLTYKKFSMMFTGDAEKESEAKILANNKVDVLKCDVLKGGHHGLGTSSTKNFVAAINPSYVLISAPNQMKDNVTFGAPHLKVLKNYLAAGVDKNHIFCTRWNGTITITSDGKNFSVEPQTKESWIDKWMAHKKVQKK